MNWLRPTRLKRVVTFVVIDVLAVAGVLYLAFWLRFDGVIPRVYLQLLPPLLALAVALKLPVFYVQRFYRMSWSFVGLKELIVVFMGVTYGSLLLGTALFVFRETHLMSGFPRSILLLDYGATLFVVGGVRLLKRVYLQLRQKPLTGKPTLVVGAGDAGEQLVRSLLKERHPEQLPLGFVDDDPAKLGLVIHGLPVMGACRELEMLIRRYGVETVLIAMPSADSAVIRATVARARQAGVRDVKVLPSLGEIFSGKVAVEQLRRVNLEDLLGRSPARIDQGALEGFLRGKVVLVTGAAGSIGSELCRQVARFSPKALALLDQDESGLFLLERQLSDQFRSVAFEALVSNVVDRAQVADAMRRCAPQIVFHAAAYKHVGLMQRHPAVAVKNNVLGTRATAEAALAAGVERFVLISTDKAVNPTSVMGVSKRLCEILILALNGKGATRFSAVRFGNVLGSRGSVVPLFEEQIKRGGPVTVTHPEMRRYFMVTSEAVLLVLQAGAMGQGGEVFVLDMGQPVKILDLARELIRLHGYEPDRDIPIVMTQPQAGEKLDETLMTKDEGATTTQHERVSQARLRAEVSAEGLWAELDGFEAGEFSDADTLAMLRRLVPEFGTHSDQLAGRAQFPHQRPSKGEVT